MSYLNKLYGMMPTVDLSSKGIALAVLFQNKKNIKGLKFLIDGHENFQISIKDFEKLLSDRRIDYANDIDAEFIEGWKKQFLTNEKRGV